MAQPRSRPHVRNSLKPTLKLKKRPCTNNTRWPKACCRPNIYLVCRKKQTLHTTTTNQHTKSDIAQYRQFEIAPFWDFTTVRVCGFWVSSTFFLTTLMQHSWKCNLLYIMSTHSMLTWQDTCAVLLHHTYSLTSFITLWRSDQQIAMVTLTLTWSLSGTWASWPPASSCWMNPLKTHCTTWLRWPTSRSW